MKTLLKLALALLLLLLLAFGAAVLFADNLAARAVERGGTYALGVPTTVGSASVGLLGGDVGLSNLRVDNPEGFEAPFFLTLGEGRLQVELASLRQDVVQAPLLSFEKVVLHVERRQGRTNYAVLLENLERLRDPSAPPEEEPGKRYAIAELVVRDIEAHFDLLPAGGALTQVRVQVPEIRLQDIGSGGGATVAEIAGVVIQALLEASIEAGGTRIPTEMLGDLRDRLGRLEATVGERVREELDQIGERAGRVLEGLQKDPGSVLERLKR